MLDGLPFTPFIRGLKIIIYFVGILFCSFIDSELINNRYLADTQCLP